MKAEKLIVMGAVLFTALSSFGLRTVDTYTFKMALNVPRIYDNMESRGYRKYQRQSIQGNLYIVYEDDQQVDIYVDNLVNKTHKINGERITYECYRDEDEYTYPMVTALGNNKTMKFTQSGMLFNFIADPSYNIGGVEEDNSLYIQLSGHGNLKYKAKYLCEIPTTIRGSVTGKLGCGCRAYGHVSPTRIYLGYITDIVFDVAPVDGTWYAKFKERQHIK